MLEITCMGIRNLIKKTVRKFSRKSSFLFIIVVVLVAFFANDVLAADGNPITPPESAFDLINPSKDINLGTWSTNVIVYAPLNAATKVVVGGDYDLEKWIRGEHPLPKYEDLTYYFENGRMPGGMAGVVGLGGDYVTNEAPVPTDLALFMNNVSSDTLFNRSAYAQAPLSQPTDFFRSVTFSTWQVLRNIALLATGVVLAFGALSVIFRQKLNPQVVATIYNVLPYVPIGLLIIVLSYPLVAIAYNLTIPLMNLMYSLGFKIAVEMGGPSWGSFYFLFDAFIVSIMLAPLTGGVSSITSVFIVLVILFTVVVGLILVGAWLFQWAKTYINFIILVFFLPFIGLAMMFPGKQHVFGAFMKRVFVNLIAWPLMTFTTVVGIGIVVASGTGFHFDNRVQYLFSGLYASVLKIIIGYGVIFTGLKIRSSLEGAFGVTGSALSSVLGSQDASHKR